MVITVRQRRGAKVRDGLARERDRGRLALWRQYIDQVHVASVVTNLPAEHRGVELGEPRASGQSSAATTRRAVIPAMAPRYDLCSRHLEHSWTETPPDGDGDATCPPLRRTFSQRLTAGRFQVE